MVMKEKELKDYSYNELVNFCTGQAIMQLGEGKSMRDIVSFTIHYATFWQREILDEIEKKKDKK